MSDQYNLANLFEQAVDHFPDRVCLVSDDGECTFAEMEARANQLAHYLASRGIGPGDHVGIYAYNCTEWVETLWAVFKLRAIWINVNYRYVEEELAYIFDYAELKALVVQRQFLPRVGGVLGNLPDLKDVLVLEDGSDCQLPDSENVCQVAYEAALADQSTERDFGPRSGDDLYMLFTGGTTGMPKGVIWKHSDVLFALGGGINMETNQPIKSAAELVEKGKAMQLCMYTPAPLMHGAAQWTVMGGAFEGRKTVISAKFEPLEVWRTVAKEKVNGLFITGDAMARPLIEAHANLEEDLDLSNFFLIASSAVVFSAEVKDQFFEAFPNLYLLDSIGSSEGGGNGLVKAEKGQKMEGGPRVTLAPGTAVLDQQTLKPLAPGGEPVGILARSGYIPLRYHRAPEKTAETFITGGDGKRYAVPGDLAKLHDDGTVTLLGRGSACINSGGEKIFVEEVESAVKSHPSVYDVTVVGVSDERFGKKVAALVELREGMTVDLDSLQSHCRQKIAGYKIPRLLHVVDKVQRSPSGKPDYRWAAEVAEARA